MISPYLDRFSAAVNATVITDREGRELQHDEAYSNLVRLLLEKKAASNMWLYGNGGSSGIVSHAAVDFMNACGFKAMALTDNSLLTCQANDFGYENVFRQPLKTLLRSGDIALGISSSGKSPNIVNASNYARENGAYVITYSGFKADNPLRETGDINFWLPAQDYGIVEMGHAVLVHILTDELMKHHTKP